jgi:glycosyltransferase involved in cell wall biosynthesis
MKRSAAVISIDHATYEIIKINLPSVKIILIPNFVVNHKFPTAKKASKLDKKALFLGWVIPSKGIGELLESWTNLKLEGWTLDVIGPVDNTYKLDLLEIYPDSSIVFHGLLPHSTSMEFMYQCDLFIEPNIIIECDGDYFHNYPNGKEIDRIRTKELNDQGYKLIRFWEHEIKEDINLCKKKILEVMDEKR